MNCKIKKIWLLVFILGLQAWARAQDHPSHQRIRDIDITGNRSFSKSKILSWLNLKKEATFSENILQEKLLYLLQEFKRSGRYFAEIDSIQTFFDKDSTEVDVRIFLQEGPKIKIKDIHIEGNRRLTSKDILRDFRSQVGGTFYEGALERDIEGIIKKYENKGYPLCQVHLTNLILDKATAKAHISLHIDEGPAVRINEIEIQGNKVTKDKLIMRAAGIKRDELYREKKIARIPNRLMKLGYFKSVADPQISIDESGGAKVLIKLEEGRGSSFDGILGYNPAPAGKKGGFFTGLLDLSFRNLFGTGRRFDAHWERKDKNSQELKVYYQEPWVLGYPVSLGLGFEQLIQDTTYIQRTLGVDVSLSVANNLTAFTKFTKRDIHPDSLGRVLFDIPRSETVTMSFGLNYDTRDDRWNPRRGVLYSTAMEFGRKTIKASEVSIIKNGLIINHRLSFDMALFVPLFRQQVFAFSLHGRRATSSEDRVPIEEQFRFGGARSLRGYRENQFRGSRIAWVNMEYRYLLGDKSRAFLFADGGYYFRKEKTHEIYQSQKIGYGLGVRIETRLGIVGVDYGLGEGDGFTNGKIHVSLMNEF